MIRSIDRIHLSRCISRRCSLYMRHQRYSLLLKHQRYHEHMQCREVLEVIRNIRVGRNHRLQHFVSLKIYQVHMVHLLEKRSKRLQRVRNFELRERYEYERKEMKILTSTSCFMFTRITTSTFSNTSACC